MATKKGKSAVPVYYATGRRKTAIARVRLIPGKGAITINARPVAEYFNRRLHHSLIREPFDVAKAAGKFDVLSRAHGGGVTGQAGALRLGIARALVNFDPELRPLLRKAGCLTRDPREKERKKYGRKRARKRFQWTKR